MRDGPPKTVIGFEVQRALVRQLDETAERLDVSRSEILRLALLSFLDTARRE